MPATATVTAGPAAVVRGGWTCATQACAKYAGQSLPAGTNAYWDASARTVTCSAIACAQADGLTEVTERWAGNPDGKISLRPCRVGSPAPVNPLAENVGGKRVIVTCFNSGATTYRNARGRCEDAPCCGCCS